MKKLQEKNWEIVEKEENLLFVYKGKPVAAITPRGIIYANETVITLSNFDEKFSGEETSEETREELED